MLYLSGSSCHCSQFILIYKYRKEKLFKNYECHVFLGSFRETFGGRNQLLKSQ